MRKENYICHEITVRRRPQKCNHIDPVSPMPLLAVNSNKQQNESFSFWLEINLKIDDRTKYINYSIQSCWLNLPIFISVLWVSAPFIATLLVFIYAINNLVFPTNENHDYYCLSIYHRAIVTAINLCFCYCKTHEIPFVIEIEHRT